MSYFSFKVENWLFSIIKSLKGQITFYAIMFYTVLSLHIVFFCTFYSILIKLTGQYIHPKGKSHLMIVPCILLLHASLVNLSCLL